MRRLARETALAARKKGERPASAPPGKKTPVVQEAWGSPAGRTWKDFKKGHVDMQCTRDYVTSDFNETWKNGFNYKRTANDKGDFKAGFTGCSAYQTGPHGQKYG